VSRMEELYLYLICGALVCEVASFIVSFLGHLPKQYGKDPTVVKMLERYTKTVSLILEVCVL
jgi:hypothetical protein